VKQFLMLVLALLLPISAHATEYGYDWFLPVPSGLTEGDIMIATRSDTLVNVAGVKTDSNVFLPALDNCTVATPSWGQTHSNNFIASPVASYQWALARHVQSATEAYVFRCSLNSWLQRAGGHRGVKLTKVRLVYQVLGSRIAGTNPDGLATHWFETLATAGYTDAGEIRIGSSMIALPTLGGVFNSLATQTRGTPYVSELTIPTANQAYLPYGNETDIFVQWGAAIPKNVVMRLFGVSVYFDRRDH